MRARLLFRGLIDATILLLLVLTASRLIGVARYSSATSSANTPAVKRGDILSVPGVRFVAPRTVVLVVNSTCPACNANVPLYRRLASMATAQVQVLAVSSEPGAVIAKWLRENRVDVTGVTRVADPLSHGLSLTPVILIVDAAGRVTDLMIRKLDDKDQARVVERVRDPNSVALDNSLQVHEISLADFPHITSHRVQLLDVRPRDYFRDGHRPDAVNIPSTELAARAPIELDSSSPVIVDCLQSKAVACRSAAWTLVDAGFGHVSLLIR